jgi:hypothetical protein
VLVIDTHVGEIDRAVDNRGGIAADPDVVAVALASYWLGWEVNRLPNSIQAT